MGTLVDKRLNPFVDFAGDKRESKALNDEFRTRCVVTSFANGRMNEELTIDWVKNIVGKFSFSRRLLAWDTYDAHLTDGVNKLLITSNTDIALIPGGCTKYVQSPDVCLNKPFKVNVAKRYDKWLSDGVHEFTAAGDMKPVPRRKIVEWVLKSWGALSKEMARKSFKICGINLPVDGSEDHLIHCFKEESACASGAKLLQDQMAILNDSSLNDNPFSEIIDPTDSDIEDAYPTELVVKEDKEDDMDIDNCNK